LCQNGGPEQKVIIFCTREIHADRVAMELNNLYVHWCRERNQTPKEHYAFKCMGGKSNGADMIEPMRGSRIHEETGKYKFWLYDYTGVTELFGTDFITRSPRPKPDERGGNEGGDNDGGWDEPEPEEPPAIAEIKGQFVTVTPQGRFILCNRDGRDVPIPVDEYRREMVQRVLREAHNLDQFRGPWIETQKRRQLINHLLGDNFSPELLLELDNMVDFDLYDLFAHHGYRARALKRPERNQFYLMGNQDWFDGVDPKAAMVLKGLGRQFELGGTDALETPALWEVPEIRLAGGFAALRVMGRPVDVMRDAKGRLFAA